MEWFNDHIDKFDEKTQFNLRKCAEEFLKTDKINIEDTPKYNRDYTKEEIIELSSIFRIAKVKRKQCILSATIVFPEFLSTFGEDTIPKKLIGEKGMWKVIQQEERDREKEMPTS